MRASRLEAGLDHLPAQERDLRLQRQLLRADIVTPKQRHAAEYAVVVADQLVELLVGALIARIEREARDLVEADRAGEVLDAAVDFKLAEKSGSWYSYNGERLGQGKDAVCTMLRENTVLLAEMEAKVRARYASDAEPEVKAAA